MIDGRDYYYLVHSGRHEESGAYHCHYTAIHMKTSIEGVASSDEWLANGGESPTDAEVKELAFRRMCEAVIDHYDRVTTQEQAWQTTT